MGGLTRVLVAAAVAVASTVATVHAAIPETLVIRVYDSADVRPHDRARAIRDAGQILGGAGLPVEWRDCPAVGPVARRCRETPTRTELIVRLVRAPGAAGVLGESLIDVERGRGTLATVFVNRIEALARQVDVDDAWMLGRVIAHEVGHLLLGHNGHSPSGLMREFWTYLDLRTNRPRDWQFSDVDRTRLHIRRAAEAAGAETGPMEAPPMRAGG
jgi:hypothetical protein